MKRLETAVLGGLIGAIAGVVARYHSTAPTWGTVLICAGIGLVAGFVWSIARR